MTHASFFKTISVYIYLTLDYVLHAKISGQRPAWYFRYCRQLRPTLQCCCVFEGCHIKIPGTHSSDVSFLQQDRELYPLRSGPFVDETCPLRKGYL